MSAAKVESLRNRKGFEGKSNSNSEVIEGSTKSVNRLTENKEEIIRILKQQYDRIEQVRTVVDQVKGNSKTTFFLFYYFFLVLFFVAIVFLKENLCTDPDSLILLL